MPRVGSLALAFLGRIRKAQEPFAVAPRRRSLALKRIFEAVLVNVADTLTLDARAC